MYVVIAMECSHSFKIVESFFLLYEIVASIHFLCGSVMGLMNIYWPFDLLSTHHTTSHSHAVSAAQKDLFNRSFGFFKSIALVGLMR